jgi:purine-binding chemotaxis protein CheW
MTETSVETSVRGGPGVGLGARLAGKYMTFKLADEVYGLEILKVREIIGMMEITKVPRSPEALRGVINLRGKVIPVTDLRCAFGLPTAEASDQNVIIVVQLSAPGGVDFMMGLLVDEVLEVLFIGADQIEPPPDFGTSAGDTQFLLGVGKAQKRVVFLLDIGKVLSVGDLVEAAGLVPGECAAA